MIGATRRRDFDVMIVGGGMVGAALAALLARDERLSGWRIAIIEPAAVRPPDDGVVDRRVSAVSRASERILRSVEAWDPVARHACPYGEMVVWDAASRCDARDALHFSAAETGEPDLGHIVENLRVQRSLLDSRYARSATVLSSGLEALEIEAESARVRLADGRRFSCGLVVGADGGGSRTRELSGIGRAGWNYGQSAVVAHLRTERPHRHTAWQRFLPDGPLALLPLADGRVSLVWSTATAAAEQARTVAAEEFAKRVTEASDRVLGRVELDSERAALPLALWHSREYVRPRLALVGDAAHTIHPLAGQGVNLGFLDAACLVEVLGDAVAAGSEPFELRSLRRYERWRRSENALMLGTTDTLNRLFGEKSVTLAAARRLGLSIVAGQPLLRRALIRRALGLAGDLPALVTRPGYRQ
jgi:2-octaprenylphenol hydroxylase